MQKTLLLLSFVTHCFISTLIFAADHKINAKKQPAPTQEQINTDLAKIGIKSVGDLSHKDKAAQALKLALTPVIKLQNRTALIQHIALQNPTILNTTHNFTTPLCFATDPTIQSQMSIVQTLLDAKTDATIKEHQTALCNVLDAPHHAAYKTADKENAHSIAHLLLAHGMKPTCAHKEHKAACRTLSKKHDEEKKSDVR